MYFAGQTGSVWFARQDRNSDVGFLLNTVWRDYVEGRVDLVQVRRTPRLLESEVYQYIAVKRTPKGKPVSRIVFEDAAA